MPAWRGEAEAVAAELEGTVSIIAKAKGLRETVGCGFVNETLNLADGRQLRYRQVLRLLLYLCTIMLMEMIMKKKKMGIAMVVVMGLWWRWQWQWRWRWQWQWR